MDVLRAQNTGLFYYVCLHGRLHKVCIRLTGITMLPAAARAEGVPQLGFELVKRNRGSIPSRIKRYSSPQPPDRLCQHNALFTWYRAHFSQLWISRGVKLTLTSIQYRAYTEGWSLTSTPSYVFTVCGGTTLVSPLCRKRQQYLTAHKIKITVLTSSVGI